MQISRFLQEQQLQLCSLERAFFRSTVESSRSSLKKPLNNKFCKNVNSHKFKVKKKSCKIYKRNRRPVKSKQKRAVDQKFRILSYNVNSLQSRLLSLSNVLSDLKPKLWSLQETHFRKPGQIKFEGSESYQIYELTRNDRGGGGLAIGVDKGVQSVWVRQGEGEVETLTVMVTVSGLSVRVTNGYGPQEYDSSEKKDKFWQYLQDEVNFSNTQGIGCIFMLDSNSWLGCKMIKHDPHLQNQNGKLFETFLKYNSNMHILNNKEFCEGKITRSRTVNGKSEQSIIDFILVCDQLLPSANYMYIDEKRKYSLPNFCLKKKG